MVKNIEVEVLQKVLAVIEEKLPQEVKLIQEYKAVVEDMTERNTNRNQSYAKKAEYYRVAVKAWRKENPEKSKEYSKRYQEKKKAKRKEKVLYLNYQGKTVSEIAEELKISKKTVVNCLEEIQNLTAI